MRIDILTIFPGMFESPLQESILKRAQEKKALEIHISDIRDFAFNKHRSVDDYPFGGGPGMVMMPEPVLSAIESLPQSGGRQLLLMSPQGKVFTQDLARELSSTGHLVMICGHYEGVDERVRESVDMELSIGDYVLTGGEIPALVVIDAVARLLPGVLGDELSVVDESFSDGLLEYPQYTRPRELHGLRVPEVLLSGNHAQIRRWRRQQSLYRTCLRRPELLAKASLSEEDLSLLTEITSKKNDA